MASTISPAEAGVFGPIAAATYERTMGRWSRRLAPLFLDFAGAARDGERALDLGCGTGSLAFALAARSPGAAVTGCDIAEPLLAHARAVNPDPARIRFEAGDACALPYPDGGFDWVLSSLVLMLIPEGERAAREMARVARPGGTVAAAVWDFRGGVVHSRLALDTAAALDPEAAAFRDRFHAGLGLRPGELAGVWRRIGLREVREADLTIRMEFADFADFWGPMSEGNTFGTMLRGLPEGRRALIRDRAEAAYRSGEPDGPRSFAATAWAVAGIR